MAKSGEGSASQISLLPDAVGGDRREGKVLGLGAVALPPRVEEPPIAERDVLSGIDAETLRRAVDPLGWAFEFGKVADRRLVHHAVALAFIPLGAPLFVVEGSGKSYGSKDLGQSISVRDFGLGLNAVFVGIFAWAGVGKAFVGERPAAGIAAQAQDLGAGTQAPVRRVVKHVALKAARRLEAKSGVFQPVVQPRNVLDAKFDFGLDRHVKERVYGRQWQSQRAKGDNRCVKTLRLAVDPGHLETPRARETLSRAAEILRGGGLVALPTETVYGLGANASDAVAVSRIFAAKGRPAWDPVIVHIADFAMLDRLVTEVPEAARKLMHAFWPGPLTLLLSRSGIVPDAVTAGRPLVGVRMPAHPVALGVIRIAGVPVAAPSANLFGHISPTTAEHVLDDLDGRIDAVLDAGPTVHGMESTVLDPCQNPMVIYRPGAVTAAQIRDIAGAVETFRVEPAIAGTLQSGLPSPGVGLRHYAPNARLVLVDAPLADLAAELTAAAQRFPGERIGIMLPAEVPANVSGAILYPWGRWPAADELARALYAGLRALDAQGCTVILCPVPPEDGVGAAIRDRLRKAAEPGE